MNMKLSDAIRAGSKMHPASKTGWIEKAADGTVRTCALIAAVEGAGIVSYDGQGWRLGPDGRLCDVKIDPRTGVLIDTPSINLEMPEAWKPITDRHELPPCECKIAGVSSEVGVIIWHLHDIHMWSREAVAEWIGTIEEKVARMMEESEEEMTPPEKKIKGAALAEKP